MLKMGWALLLLLVLAGCSGSSAAPDTDRHSVMPGVDEYAEAMVKLTTRVWIGPRVPFPKEHSRPRVTQTAISMVAPVAVHASERVDAEKLDAALRELEESYRSLSVLGWPLPVADADLGGGGELDVYLVPSDPRTEAFVDAPVMWSYLDRASTFAVIDESVGPAELPACVASALVKATLLALDPAEAPRWRDETAAWLSEELSGTTKCADDEDKDVGLLLAFLSARHDGASGSFVRDVWELASQRTWEGQGLRASPDMWGALDTALRMSGDSLDDNIEAFAIAKVGEFAWTGRLSQLPKRVVHRRAVDPYESAYLRLEIDAHDHGLVRAWFEGEYGVRWSFVTLQVDGSGTEVGRLSAPRTSGTPRAFLPIELDRGAKEVIFIVTNLSSRLPDADAVDTNERAFQVTLLTEP